MYDCGFRMKLELAPNKYGRDLYRDNHTVSTCVSTLQLTDSCCSGNVLIGTGIKLYVMTW